MAGAGRLDVSLGLNAAEYTRGLDKATRDAEKFQRDMVSLGKTVGTAFGVGLVAAAAGVLALTKSAIDAADHLNDLSKATGVSVEQLGGIGFAAKQSGTDLDGVAQSFGKLNLKIAEAARGEKEATEAFKVLGVAVKDATGKTRSADAVFQDLAEAFSSFADGPEKAALGMAVFGKSYQSVLPLLADGGKALQDNIDFYKRFGGTTTETARAADEFNDTLGKLSFVTGQLGRKLAEELLPPLQAVADELLRAAETSGAFDFLARAARTAFEVIAILFANVKFVFEGVGREIAAVAAQMTALATLDFDGFRAISDAVKEDGVRARAELDALEKRIQGIGFSGLRNQTGSGLLNPDRLLDRANNPLRQQAPRLSGPETKVKKLKEEIDENTRAYARYVEQLSDGLEKEEKLSKVQEVTRAIEQNRFGVLIPQQKEVLLFLAQAADAQDEYNERIKENARLQNQVNEENERFQKSVADLTGRTQTKQDLQALKDLDEALRLGIISLEEFKQGQDRLAGFDKELEKSNDAARELGLTFSSALEDAIVDFTSLRDVVKGLEQDLLRIGTRKLVTEPLANWATEMFKGLGSGGGGGDGFGAILGALFGGGGGGLSGVFASGTDFVPRDGLAYLHRGEKVIPARESRTASNSMVFNFTVNGQVNRATADQIAADVSRSVNRASRRLG